MVNYSNLFTSLNCSSKEPEPGVKEAAGLLELARGGVGGKVVRLVDGKALMPTKLGLASDLELGDR